MPTLETTTTLDHVEDYVVSNGGGFFRRAIDPPGGSGPYVGPPYPVWRNPDDKTADAAPGPRQKNDPVTPDSNDDIVVSLFDGGGIPRPREGKYSRIDTVEFIIRARRPNYGKNLWNDVLRPMFYHPGGLNLAGWTMAGASYTLFVLSLEITRELQRVDQMTAEGWSYSAEIAIERYSTPGG